MPKTDNKKDNLKEVLQDNCHDESSESRHEKKEPREHKRKRCGCSEKSVCACKGNECCGNANCVVAALDTCDAPCAGEAQNLVITSKRHIPSPLPCGAPFPTGSGLTYNDINYYITLPNHGSAGPVELVWAPGLAVLNFLQGAGLASILTIPGYTAHVNLKLNILSQKQVFDSAKHPAGQSNGFASFGGCNCKDVAVTYTIVVDYSAPASVAGEISGTYYVLDSQNNVILFAGLGDFLSIPAIGFTVSNGSATLKQRFLFDITNAASYRVNADGLEIDIVNPAVILKFVESKGKDDCSKFLSLIDYSRLQA